ncbi:MAG: hypothetical protein IT449_11175 [Phycisphaerales bacterium]|nr:hypothetical protein [Phycisphaerales bacterium]
MLCLFAEARAVAPDGSSDLLSVALLAWIPACVAFPAAFVACAAMCSGRARRWAAPLLAVCLTWVAAFLIVPRWGWSLRREGFARLAERSRPLIEAIEAFEEAEGRPPASLGELVPGYLPNVPTTGMKAYPRYVYRVAPEAKKPDPVSTPQEDPLKENRWSIWVPCSSGMLDFDAFTYWPLKNYPDTFGGASLERIGDWAYEHE